MSKSEPISGAWEARTVQDTKRLAVWTAGWVLTMAVANFGPHFLWSGSALTVLAILVNVLVGGGMIMANVRHLKGLDEMQQRIQLDAMGMSLGVGLVLGLAYSNLDTSGVIASDAEISHLVILMALTYMVGIFYGQRKYR